MPYTHSEVAAACRRLRMPLAAGIAVRVSPFAAEAFTDQDDLVAPYILQHDAEGNMIGAIPNFMVLQGGLVTDKATNG